MGALLKQYIWVLNILAVLFFSYFAAKITNVYLGRLLEVSRSIGVVKQGAASGDFLRPVPKSHYDVIADRDIFDSREEIIAPPAEEEEKKVAAQPTGVAVKTTLGIKLQAVLVVGSGKDDRSNAVVKKGNQTGVYAPRGKEIFHPGVVLVQIKPDRIEFLNSGRLEYAELDSKLGESIFKKPGELVAAKSAGKTAVEKKEEPKEKKVGEISEGKFVIDQSEINDALENIDKLYTQIRAVPFFKDGKVQGMKVFAVRPGSIFSKLGLKRGDVLQRINGVELDVKRGFEIFSQLRDQKSFTLDLQRGSGNKTLEYEIR